MENVSSWLCFKPSSAEGIFYNKSIEGGPSLDLFYTGSDSYGVSTIGPPLSIVTITI